MSALDNIEFYNPFKENLKKIDGLVVCKTKNDVEIHCCMVIKMSYYGELSKIMCQLTSNNNGSVEHKVFADESKGCYLRCYVDNIEYVTIIVQFLE